MCFGIFIGVLFVHSNGERASQRMYNETKCKNRTTEKIKWRITTIRENNVRTLRYEIVQRRKNIIYIYMYPVGYSV